MTLKTKYRLLLFTAIISVPIVLLGISVSMSIMYEFAFKTRNKGTPFHESFAYPTMLIVFFLSLCLLAFLFSKSINSLLTKINMLNKTIRDLASNERTPNTLAVDSEDEIGQLIQSVNILIERTTYRELELQQQQELQKELLQKLRHDINTPLTAIRLQLFYVEDAFKEQPKLVESLNEQIQYIASLTNELNWQSLDTMENSYIVQEEVQLTILFETMIKKWSYLYRMQNIELIYHPEDTHLVWTSNELWLQRMFDNVFQNTLKHSKATKLEITIKDHKVFMTDDGTGFEHNHGGEGLGLKIIDDIARILQVNYSLHSNEEGTEFCFSLNKIKKN
ncbi:HAMP domain-containing histidine kinase [Lysinibacillus xylanilyticus]|uniref:sensor histidine kinase n=1 Tax=Lysinibacillus xylanilyticus TaxID=582475 RepID=UPI002B2551B0|nr:HAMP domain-containing sensor histidine kinase [Lysinibacillus xylanilyticus]MEB2301210.1 HAMP domain-containing histidine kinase [Lysinibacillus xylanilyticus]